MKKPHKIFFAQKKGGILFEHGLSIWQLSAHGCWKVALLLLLLLQKKCEYHRPCCDSLVAAACQYGSAWNERKNLQHCYQLIVNMVWDLWKSCARTFRCLALLWWERTSGKGAMRAIVGSNIYCSLLNSKSPLVCIVGMQRKDHTELLVFCKWMGVILHNALPGLQRLALTGRLKTAKCECLWSSAHCQVRMFLKQPNRRLQQLLAVENKTILQQLKPSTFCMIFHITLIFYPHHTGMRSQMLYTNGSFEICQERMFVKQRRKDSWSIYLRPKKIFMLKQKSLNLYMICFNSVKSFWVIIYTLCINKRSQMLCTNGSFEICQERMFVKQCRTHGWSTYLLSKIVFMFKQKSSNIYMIGFNSVRKFLSDWLSTLHYVRNRSQWNAMWWDNQPPHGYSRPILFPNSAKHVHNCRQNRHDCRQNIPWLLWNALLTTP